MRGAVFCSALGVFSGGVEGFGREQEQSSSVAFWSVGTGLASRYLGRVCAHRSPDSIAAGGTPFGPPRGKLCQNIVVGTLWTVDTTAVSQ